MSARDVIEISPVDALDDYLLGLSLKRDSVIHKRAHCGKFAEWMMDGKTNGYGHALALAELRIQHLRRYLAHRANIGRDETTRYHDATQIRCWLDYCRSVGYIADDPMSGIKVRKPKPKLPRLPTDEQVRAIRQAVRDFWDSAERQPQKRRTFMGRRDYALLLLLEEAALRRSEPLRLRLSDVTIDGQPATPSAIKALLDAPKEVRQKAYCEVRLSETKDGTPRVVPVSETWMRALKDYLTVRPVACPTDILFVNNAGHRMDPRLFNRKFKVYATLAACPQVTPQWIRRWRENKWLATGKLRAAAGLTGHSLVTAERHYNAYQRDELHAVVREARAGEDDMLVNARSEKARRKKADKRPQLVP